MLWGREKKLNLVILNQSEGKYTIIKLKNTQYFSYNVLYVQ